MGLSTAYHLSSARSSPSPSITVIEKDPSYQYASSTLSAGGIRQQFSLKENIEMSLYGRDFLREAETLLNVNVSFEEKGYLFLACSKEGKKKMIKNWELQRTYTQDIKLLDKKELKKKFEWLNVEDVLMGSYGERGEGWFDPWALLKGFRDKSTEMGVKFVHGEVVAAKRNARGEVSSVDVKVGEKIVTYFPQSVVNAAGPYADNLMNILAGSEKPLQHPIPVRPRKRCIYFIHSPSSSSPSAAPLTVDPTNVYFRSEGGSNHFICGAPPSDEINWDYDTHTLQNPSPCFESTIWPQLYHRVPSFDELKVKSSWCGLYEYNIIDQNGIIGFHPEMENVIMLNGFSGHGLQQSPAVGRACMELLDKGGFETLDLGRLDFERFLNGNLMFEDGIV